MCVVMLINGAVIRINGILILNDGTVIRINGTVILSEAKDLLLFEHREILRRKRRSSE